MQVCVCDVIIKCYYDFLYRWRRWSFSFHRVSLNINHQYLDTRWSITVNLFKPSSFPTLVMQQITVTAREQTVLNVFPWKCSTHWGPCGITKKVRSTPTPPCRLFHYVSTAPSCGFQLLVSGRSSNHWAVFFCLFVFFVSPLTEGPFFVRKGQIACRDG